MATMVRTEVVDDLDGSPAEESVHFGVDGVSYEIDLNTDNAAALRQVLLRYVDYGRRTGGRRIRRQNTTEAPVDPTPAPPPAATQVLPAQQRPLTSSDRAALTKFAKKNGLKPPGKVGRVARSLRDAWQEAGFPR